MAALVNFTHKPMLISPAVKWLGMDSNGYEVFYVFCRDN